MLQWRMSWISREVISVMSMFDVNFCLSASRSATWMDGLGI